MPDAKLHDAPVDETVHLKVRPATSAQSLRITVLAGPDAGASSVLPQRTVIIGRGHADFRLTDPSVSSFHVEASCAEGGIAVRDLESRNGTVFAGARLGQAIVPSGAQLTLGSSIVQLDSDVAFKTPKLRATSFGRMRGMSAPMRELFTLLERLARTELSVLLAGPTGTGKELAARALHAASDLASGPFVVLDCTAIPPTLAESILFGHERGAFTGANERRIGVFEAAEGGTIFLDELGELSLDLQPKLLRVLEQRQITRVGSSRARDVHVRVISATWHDLRALVNRGRFREDLYYRIAQARVTIPPLRDRPEDIPMLVHHFLESIPPQIQCARSISDEALTELMRRDYPGNARELKNTIERAAMMAAGDIITPADLAFERLLNVARTHAPSILSDAPKQTDDLVPFKEAKRTLIGEFERGYLERLLTRSNNNLSRAAGIAGLERHYLRDLLRKHGLRGDD